MLPDERGGGGSGRVLSFLTPPPPPRSPCHPFPPSKQPFTPSNCTRKLNLLPTNSPTAAATFLLFLPSVLFASPLLLIYTFSASSNSKRERLFPHIPHAAAPPLRRGSVCIFSNVSRSASTQGWSTKVEKEPGESKTEGEED